MSDEILPQTEEPSVKLGASYIGRLTHWLAPIIAVFTYVGSVAVFALGIAKP